MNFDACEYAEYFTVDGENVNAASVVYLPASYAAERTKQQEEERSLKVSNE